MKARAEVRKAQTSRDHHLHPKIHYLLPTGSSAYCSSQRGLGKKCYKNAHKTMIFFLLKSFEKRCIHRKKICLYLNIIGSQLCYIPPNIMPGGFLALDALSFHGSTANTEVFLLFHTWKRYLAQRIDAVTLHIFPVFTSD